MASILTTITPQEIAYQEQNINDDRGATVSATVSVFSTMAFLTVLLRLIARKRTHAAWHLDDYIMIVGLILALGMETEALLLVRYGAGQHSLKVGIAVVITNLQTVFALEFTYVFAHLAVKVSILQLFKSIFTLHNRRFKIAWYSMLAYVIACWIIGLTVVLKQCTPIGFAWGQFWGWKGTCVDLRASVIGNGATIVLADLALLILPMPMLWKLKIRMAQKLQLSVIFAMGILALAASIVRIWTIVRVKSLIDFTFVEVDTLIWTILEVDIGIICACVPTLRPLLKGSRARTNASTNTKSSSSNTAKSRTLIGPVLGKLIGKGSKCFRDNNSIGGVDSKDARDLSIGASREGIDLTGTECRPPKPPPKDPWYTVEKDVGRCSEEV